MTHSVLILEDQAVIRSLLIRLLTQRGFRVAGAPDIAAATALVSGGTTFDLLIADSHLPDGDGLAFARAAKSRAVVAAAVATSGETVDARAHGLDGFLPKPFSVDVLMAVIGQALPTG